MKKKILIIEDDEDTAELLLRLIRFFNYEGILSANSLSITDISVIKPDLIMLDHKLKNSFGGNLCQGLKVAEATKNIPILMVSATDNLNEIAVGCGADDYLHKPFDIDDLQKKIGHLLVNQ